MDREEISDGPVEFVKKASVHGSVKVQNIGTEIKKEALDKVTHPIVGVAKPGVDAVMMEYITREEALKRVLEFIQGKAEEEDVDEYTRKCMKALWVLYFESATGLKNIEVLPI